MKGTVKKVSEMALAPEYLATGDLNTIATSGSYQVSSSVSHLPVSGYSYYVVMIKSSDNYCTQIAFRFGATPFMYVRNKNNGSWTSWGYVQMATPTST